jgi:archaemetzincin
MQKVVGHELGHTLGLGHCSDPACLMTAAEGKIAAVDHQRGAMCDSCRLKLRSIVAVREGP